MPIVPTGRVEVVDQNKKAEIIASYTERLFQIAQNYKEDIKYFDSLLKQTREERTKFYTTDLDKITQSMKSDGVSSENQQEWIKLLQDNMEKSFQMSELLIQDFIISKKEEFKKMLEEELKKM